MRNFVGLVVSLLVFPSVSFAARPLSTDDAATVEKGHSEIECGFEYADCADDEYNWSFQWKYGLGEKWEAGVEIPYQYIDVADGSNVDGIGDVVFCSKYRLSDVFALGFSLKTNTGDDDRGLGTGKLDYGINAIISKEWDRVISHLNFGYTYAGCAPGHDEVFSYAAALEIPLNEKFNLAGEITAETNFEGDFDDNPFAALAGFNYALTETATFDLGASAGISEASPDYTLVTGLTFGF